MQVEGHQSLGTRSGGRPGSGQSGLIKPKARPAMHSPDALVEVDRFHARARRMEVDHGTTMVLSVGAVSPVEFRAETETMTACPLGNPVRVTARSVNRPAITLSEPGALGRQVTR
jgi:hypothetical protein